MLSRRLFLLAPLPLVGCARPAAGRVVGVSLMSLTNPFFKEIADHFAAEAARRGYAATLASGDNDVDRQSRQVQDFLVRRVDAIVLSPCESKGIGEAVRRANAAGVPVFTVDTGCLAPGAKVVTHVATDNLEGGRQAGRAVLELVGGRGGKVAVLDYKDAESCLLRVRGFKEVIDAHNNGAGGRVGVVAELPCAGAKDQGFRSTEDLLQATPDVAVVFAINDPAALGARAALEKAGAADRVKIVGFDGQPEGKKAIADGKIYADPIQYPDRLGRMTAEVIARYFDGRDVPTELLVPTALYKQADAKKDGL